MVRRVIIAGGRDFGTKDPKHRRANLYYQDLRFMAEKLAPILHLYGRDVEIVSGHAPGGDRLGEEWADSRLIPVKRFPIEQSDWDTKGKSAGPIRNREMGEYSDELVAFWDGRSLGTSNMIRTMMMLRKPLHVFFYV